MCILQQHSNKPAAELSATLTLYTSSVSSQTLPTFLPHSLPVMSNTKQNPGTWLKEAWRTRGQEPTPSLYCSNSAFIHHSFTLSLQAQNLPFQQILSTIDFFYLLDCLTITGLDRTGPITLIILFSVSHFNFLFIPYGRLSWLPVSFLLHVKYTLSYRIVFDEVLG